jgi:integrase
LSQLSGRQDDKQFEIRSLTLAEWNQSRGCLEEAGRPRLGQDRKATRPRLLFEADCASGFVRPSEISSFTPSVYRNIVRKYGLETAISAEVNVLCVHSLRATAATNALSNDSHIAKVQEWLGHANVSKTHLYNRSKSKPEDSPSFRVKY